MSDKPLVPTWSYSRLKDYEKCPLMAFLKYSERRSTDHMDRTAADRGTQTHDDAEKYVRDEGDLTKTLAKRKEYFEDLKADYEEGIVLLEDDWGFDTNWEPTGWWDDDVWARMKLDNFRVIEGVIEEPISAIATDYKTGKKFGNEVAHNQQGQLYAVGSFMRYPTLQSVGVEFVYLDQPEKQDTSKVYSRDKAMKFLPHWDSRARKMTEATDFPPKANKINCMWCPFGPQNGDGSCEWGV